MLIKAFIFIFNKLYAVIVKISVSHSDLFCYLRLLTIPGNKSGWTTLQFNKKLHLLIIIPVSWPIHHPVYC